MSIKLFSILTNLKFVDVARPPMLIRVVINRSMAATNRNVPMRCPIQSLLDLQLSIMPQLAIIIVFSLRRKLQPPIPIPIKAGSSCHLKFNAHLSARANSIIILFYPQFSAILILYTMFWVFDDLSTRCFLRPHD